MAVTSLAAFPVPPCLPRWGDSHPPPHQEVCRGRARAFLCSSPVTTPAFSLPRSGKGVAGPFLCPRARHRTCFSSRGVFFSRPRVLSSPARFVPHHRQHPPQPCVFPLAVSRSFVSLNRSVGGRRCSRRGRAAAPLPTGLAHRRPRRYPPPFRPTGIPRPSAPEGLPPCLRGRPDDRCAPTGPPLRHLVLFLARSRQTSLRDCRSSGDAAGSATA